MLIVLFLVSHFNFLFVPCGGLSWLPVSFLLHVKYTLSYRIATGAFDPAPSNPAAALTLEWYGPSWMIFVLQTSSWSHTTFRRLCDIHSHSLVFVQTAS